MSKLSPDLPRSDSQEAAQAIEAVSAERNHPTTPSACARVGWEAAVRYLSDALAAPLVKDELRIDVEDLILKCIPGGDTCDPQKVADAVREYAAALSTAPRAAQSATAGEAWMKDEPLKPDQDDQWFGDMMILQVLADSDQVDEQEREVLQRWMAASERPSQVGLTDEERADCGLLSELGDQSSPVPEALPAAHPGALERAVSAPPPQPYTNAIGEAGARYHASFPHAHHLPSLWRWEELWDAMCAAASKCAYPNCACDGPGEDGGCGSAVSAPADARPQTVRERANDLHDKAGMPMEQAVELARSEIVSYENQMIGDIMILTVLADSDAVNDQERDVLLRWIAAPSVSAPIAHSKSEYKRRVALGDPRVAAPAPEDERQAQPLESGAAPSVKLAKDGQPCPNTHDPYCGWSECLCRASQPVAPSADAGQEQSTKGPEHG